MALPTLKSVRKGAVDPNVKRHLPLSSLAVLLGTGLLIAAPYTGLGTDRFQEFVGDLGPVLIGLVATIAAWRVSSRPGVAPGLRRARRRPAAPLRRWRLGGLSSVLFQTGPRQPP